MRVPPISIFTSDGDPLRSDDVRVLTLLLTEGPMKQIDIGRALSLTRSTVTRLADKLTRLGYTERSLSADDRRVRLLRLTVEGQHIGRRLQSHTRHNSRARRRRHIPA